MDFLMVATDKWHLDDVRPNVVVPFVNEDPAARAAVRLNLEMQGLAPRYVELDASFAYDALIRRLWAEGEPFILVEHDILPWPGAVQQMWTCDRPWCAFEYLMMGELRVALGCTKFDPARLGPLPLPQEPVPWRTMDWHIIDTLATRGECSHLHEPAVSHLHWVHQRMIAPLVVREPVT
jgi:hypothetical protein